MKQAYLIQSLPIEGKNGFEEGGYTHTVTANELIDSLHQFHPDEKNIEVIGLGATAGLKGEVAYINGKLFETFSNNGKVETREISKDSKISFSQIALRFIEGLTKTQKHEKIHAENGSAYLQLLKAIGEESTKAVTITAKTKSLTSRAVCPPKDSKGNIVSPAESFANMTKHQAILEQNFETPQTIKMVGVVTGNNETENQLVKGLHLHYQGGHVLDFGELSDVTIEATPISKTLILQPQKGLENKQIWHSTKIIEPKPQQQSSENISQSIKQIESTLVKMQKTLEQIKNAEHSWVSYITNSKTSQIERVPSAA